MERLSEVQIPLPFGIEGIRVIGVQEDNGCLVIVLQKDLEFGLCPQCGMISQKIKDRHVHQVTDRSVFENETRIEVLKRRWKCLNDLCETNTFTEELGGLPRKYTHTELFYQDVYQLSRRMTYTEVYKHLRDAHCKVSLSTIYQRAQERLRKEVTLPQRVQVPFLGLDEFSTGKGHKYGVVLVDLKHNKVVDVAEGGKTKKAARQLLAKVDGQEVKACCIDMWRPFRDACREKLPGAVIVVDRFHVIKGVNEALDQVRKRARKRLKSKEKKEALFRYKELLLMGTEKLTPKQQQRLWEMLSWDEDLTRAYELKELLRAIYAGQDLKTASQELTNWISEAGSSNIEVMKEVAQTLTNWREEILNFWIYRISNAATEGKVNKIKVLRRRAYNYNNFQSLRLKILQQE